MARLAQVAADGGEGLMLHRRDAPYLPGRGDDLLKLKPYQEGEALVVEHIPGRGKYLGLLGSLLVELPDGAQDRRCRPPEPPGAVGNEAGQAASRGKRALVNAIPGSRDQWTVLGANGRAVDLRFAAEPPRLMLRLVQKRRSGRSGHKPPEPSCITIAAAQAVPGKAAVSVRTWCPRATRVCPGCTHEYAC
jgi:hypothetical protein